jgi:hypothetical protein
LHVLGRVHLPHAPLAEQRVDPVALRDDGPLGRDSVDAEGAPPLALDSTGVDMKKESSRRATHIAWIVTVTLLVWPFTDVP